MVEDEIMEDISDWAREAAKKIIEPSEKPFPTSKIIGEYKLINDKAMFILTKQDGSKQVLEAD